MAREFKVKKKLNFLDKLLVKIVALFKGKPKIINLNSGDLPSRCILIGNHNATGGPVNYSICMAGKLMPWAAHQMTEGFRSRWKYSYHIFYRQKLKYSKFKSFILATLLATFSPLAYNAVGVIPVYYDLRVFVTFKNSIKCLENDVPVFIFPENSDDGYKDTITELRAGFLQLSQIYFKKYAVDLPIYTLQYNRKSKKIIIGKPMYYQELAKEHSNEDILKIFADYMNSLTTQNI